MIKIKSKNNTFKFEEDDFCDALEKMMKLDEAVFKYDSKTIIEMKKRKNRMQL